MPLYVIAITTTAAFWVSTVVSVVAMIIAAVTQVTLWYRGRREDARNKEVAALKARIESADQDRHDMVSKLVDERIRHMSHEAANSVNSLVQTSNLLKEELKAHVAEIKILAERDQRHEIGFTESLADLREWMHTNLASKGELRDMDGHVRTLQKEVATLGARVDAVTRQHNQ